MEDDFQSRRHIRLTLKSIGTQISPFLNAITVTLVCTIAHPPGALYVMIQHSWRPAKSGKAAFSILAQAITLPVAMLGNLLFVNCRTSCSCSELLRHHPAKQLLVYHFYILNMLVALRKNFDCHPLTYGCGNDIHGARSVF